MEVNLESLGALSWRVLQAARRAREKSKESSETPKDLAKVSETDRQLSGRSKRRSTQHRVLGLATTSGSRDGREAK